MSKDKLIDFHEAAASKNGQITVKSLLDRCMENADDIDFIVTVAVMKDGGEVLTGWSKTDSTLKIVGTLEVGKIQVIDKNTG